MSLYLGTLEASLPCEKFTWEGMVLMAWHDDTVAPGDVRLLIAHDDRRDYAVMCRELYDACYDESHLADRLRIHGYRTLVDGAVHQTFITVFTPVVARCNTGDTDDA